MNCGRIGGRILRRLIIVQISVGFRLNSRLQLLMLLVSAELRGVAHKDVVVTILVAPNRGRIN
jgi:hypothetical protein